MIETEAAGSYRHVFKGQLQHALLLSLMIPGFLYYAEPSFAGGSFWGFSAAFLSAALLTVVVSHQVIGWFVFRAQLFSGLLTKLFGRADLTVWGVVFFALFFLRPLITIALGRTDSGTIPGPRWMQVILGSVLLVPVFYTLWSIHAFFGIERALGGDHFREKYRHMPLVKSGAFRYSDNAMYSFAFLVFWAIALLLGSRLALAAALFQHAYIWVHMYCTEAPDLEVLYAGDRTGSTGQPRPQHNER